MNPIESRNEATVRQIIANAKERRVLAERQARDGDRSVELLDGQYVLKQFTLSGETLPARRPWQQEHAALVHLDDPSLPVSVGYFADRNPSGLTVSYLRGFVQGEPLEQFDAASVIEAGELLAGLHARGVVTDDALTQNFMRAADGRLFFLDFGKSRIFARGNPLMAVWAALEHCRFLRASIGGDTEMWSLFRDAYFAALGRSRGFEWLVRGCSSLVLWQRRLRGRDQGDTA